MKFKKTDYNLRTNDGDDILQDAWEDGIRYFKVQGKDGVYKKEARLIQHHVVLVEEVPIIKENPLVIRIEQLEQRIIELEKGNLIKKPI